MVQSLITRFAARLGLLLAGLILVGMIAARPSLAGTANAGLRGASSANPVAGMMWGGYLSETRDPTNDPLSAYYHARHHPLLGRLVEQPRFRWFGSWVPLHDEGTKWGVHKTVTRYIEAVTQGDPDVGVQIGVFRLEPFERAACSRLPTAAERRSYKAWIREFARAIGNARVALVLQPDMPLTLCLPHHSKVDLQLIDWTTKVFAALPHTTIYIDAGSSDWDPVGRMSRMLRQAGVARVRGFALNLTHYDSTEHEVAYGKQIVADLARHGVRGKHFVVSTAMNGRPFTFQRHSRLFHEMTPCATPSSRACVTIGQPFTTDTGSSATDAYMWLGRWWYANARVRSYGELLQLIRTSPFMSKF
jgi:endoglucanase